MKELNTFRQFLTEGEIEAAAQKAFGKTTVTTSQAIEDGYYALTNNLPNLINDLEKAAMEIQSELPYSADELAIIKKEAKLYRQIQTLIDQSVLGSVLQGASVDDLFENQ